MLTSGSPGYLKTSLLGLCISLGLSYAAQADGPFTQAQLDSLAKYKKNFEQIRDQSQLIQAYRQALKLKQELAPNLDQYSESLLQAGNYPDYTELESWQPLMPGLAPLLVAEGTMIVLEPDFVSYASAAKRTPQAEDNAFFALMQQAYGEVYTDYPLWFNQTWDYGGCTRLGQGIHRRILQAAQQQIFNKSPFKPELASLEAELWQDLLQSNNFCLPQTQVVYEFEQLLPLAPQAEQPRLKLRLRALQAGSPNLGFDCDARPEACHYG